MSFRVVAELCSISFEDDELEIVIVKDMMLTGYDSPDGEETLAVRHRKLSSQQARARAVWSNA